MAKHVRDGPLFKVSPKYSGPFRVVEKLKFGKFKLRHCIDGVEKICHWNHLKLIKNDIDVAFLRGPEDSSSNNPVPLQAGDDGRSGRYNLRSRQLS